MLPLPTPPLWVPKSTTETWDLTGWNMNSAVDSLHIIYSTQPWKEGAKNSLLTVQGPVGQALWQRRGLTTFSSYCAMRVGFHPPLVLNVCHRWHADFRGSSLHPIISSLSMSDYFSLAVWKKNNNERFAANGRIKSDIKHKKIIERKCGRLFTLRTQGSFCSICVRKPLLLIVVSTPLNFISWLWRMKKTQQIFFYFL